MLPLKPITIIGGGLAGLTLGIGLRREGVPVIIWEAGQYPRHRVCGEFISGGGLAVIERMGLSEQCRQAGAVYARTAMFVLGSRRSSVRQLAAPAFCLSRHKLDALLAKVFQDTGGELRANSRWTGTDDSEGIVRALGRRVDSAEKSVRWFGVKAHVLRGQQVKLEADLEMHIARGGYVGVNYIGDGEVNVCGLFRAGDGERSGESKADWLRGAKDSLLSERLRGAEFNPASFCSVAGLQLKPQRAAARAECCVGDQLTMTPPVTGNGMSMAFESAEMAVGPLTVYSRGRVDWGAAQQQIARQCDAAFQRRLAWARVLQWMMMSPALQGPIGGWFLKSGWLWELFFARTR